MLIDDDHLAIGGHVVDVALEQRMGLERRVNVMQQVQVAGGVEAVVLLKQAHPDQLLLHLGVPPLGQLHLAVLFVHREVAGHLGRRLDALAGHLPLQFRGQAVDPLVEFRGLLGRAGDDQRGARLVNQYRVHLVDDGEVQVALELVGQREGHVVAQVVEAEFVVGAVDDVGLVGAALLFRRLPRLNDADGQPQGFVDGAHPIGIPADQIVVDGDDVDALAGDGVEGGG